MGLEIKKIVGILLTSALLFISVSPQSVYSATSISGDFGTGLSAAWYFLNGALTTDSTGSHTLTNNGSIPYSSLVQSGGADIELSSNQYFSLSNTADFNPTSSTDYSFCVWFKPESLSGVRGVISKESGATGYLIYTNGTNIYFIHQGIDQTASGGTLSNGTLYHICAVYTGAGTQQLQLYVSSGGTADATPSVSPTPRSYNSTTATFKIGERSDGSGNSDGVFGQVLFWKGYALSASDVADIYNAGTGLPYSAGGGGAVYTDPPKLIWW